MFRGYRSNTFEKHSRISPDLHRADRQTYCLQYRINDKTADVITPDTLTCLASLIVAVVGVTSAGVAVDVRSRVTCAVVLTRATIARVTHWNNKVR